MSLIISYWLLIEPRDLAFLELLSLTMAAGISPIITNWQCSWFRFSCCLVLVFWLSSFCLSLLQMESVQQTHMVITRFAKNLFHFVDRVYVCCSIFIGGLSKAISSEMMIMRSN